MGPLRCKPGHRAFCYGKQVIVLDPSQVWQWRNLRARPHCPDDCSIEQRMLPLKDSNGNIVRARLPHMLPVQMKPVTKARIMKRLTFSQKLEARRVRFNLQNGLCVGPIMSPAQLECVLEKNTLNNPHLPWDATLQSVLQERAGCRLHVDVIMKEEQDADYIKEEPWKDADPQQSRSDHMKEEPHDAEQDALEQETNRLIADLSSSLSSSVVAKKEEEADWDS